MSTNVINRTVTQNGVDSIKLDSGQVMFLDTDENPELNDLINRKIVRQGKDFIQLDSGQMLYLDNSEETLEEIDARG